MYFPRRSISGVLLMASVAAASICADAAVAQGLQSLRDEVMEKIERIETEALFNEAELSKRYAAALDGLEARLTKEGNLDAIVRLREEKESVMKSGEVTAHADPILVELREKYLTARKTIRSSVDEARLKESSETERRLKEQESALVKAGKVDEALALRKEAEELLAGISAGMEAPKDEIFEDTREGVVSPLKPVTIPQGKPPLNEKPFSGKGWLESMTVPAVKQRVSDDLWIGNRNKKKWPLVVVPKGASWEASRDFLAINLSAGNIVATDASFKGLNLLADLGSHYYFTRCSLDDCGFGKTGTWRGWDQAAKFYFENCLVTRRFNQGANVIHHGFRAQYSVFEKIDMPTINYKEREPVKYLNHPWMKFANCRFIDCKIPSSFALLTRECLFENCTFVDDANFSSVKRPVEVTVYLGANCRWNISKLPANVTITRKTQADAGGFSIPNSMSIRQKIGH